MRLISFTVTNYRSITNAHRVPVSDVTVIIGKNNEGKSNIVRALSLAMRILQNHASQSARVVRRPTMRDDRIRPEYYSWSRDFPMSLQSSAPTRSSIFRLEFELDATEVSEFRSQIGSTLNGTLPIEVKVGSDEKPTVKAAKQGKGAAALNAKSSQIAEFVARKVAFNHIPAVRTDREAMYVIEEMIDRELLELEEDTNYRAALATINSLQQKKITEIAARLTNPLREFVPNIADVRIDLVDSAYRTFRHRNLEVVIDDGTPTSIEYKGDGVKSLVALGLLKNRSYRSDTSVIAIEEPESHLHPGAIHQLNDIIFALSDSNQVIITTHNPLFVNRINLKSNIVVDSGRAMPATSVRQIREMLGVTASDNLMNANFALVVEGDDDRIVLASLLPVLSPRIGATLKSGLMIIDPISGAGNLSYKLSLMQAELFTYHVLLDNDVAGHAAFEKAETQRLLSPAASTFTVCNGMPESELEDLYLPSAYQDSLVREFGVDLSAVPAHGNAKWSDRMRDVFLKHGKPWSPKMEERLKHTVAEAIAATGPSSLNPHKRSSMDALVAALERMIDR